MRPAPILLTHSYFLLHDPKQVRKMKPYPPLATVITAAVLRQQGHDVGLFDAMLASGEDEFERRLDDARPGIVGFVEDSFNFLTKMCTTRMRESTLTMIRAAKTRGCLVAVNGSDASDQPWIYLEAGADAIILGEPEQTLVELMDVWTKGVSDLGRVRGLVLPGSAGARTGDLRRTEPRPSIQGLDALPFPAWDLIDLPRYRAAWSGAHGRLSWNMVTSRGCPYGCNWCAKPLFGRGYAQRSPANVADELRALREAVGPDHVWFADDIFGLTPRWIEAFAEAVSAQHAVTPFSIQSRVNLMTPGAVEALAQGGCEEVWMGIESGSQKVLDAMDKRSTVAQAREATRRLKARSIRACWFVQLGYPGEEWPEILLTRDLLREEHPDEIGVSVAYPLPGTEFYRRVEQQLGTERHWRTSGDLAMLFQGAYSTLFYRAVRDLLHDEATPGVATDRRALDLRWLELERGAAEARSQTPTSYRVPDPPARPYGETKVEER
jgi:anaerobic magnesium-protoporphyrin IX monomethyl ester cyclase